MKLTVTLSNQQEIKTLQWLISESDIATRWASLIKTAPRQNENYHSDFDWYMAGYTPEHFDKIVAQMTAICSRLNAEKGFDIPVDWFQNLTRDSLNGLHLKFHELAENIPNDPDINQLNYIVHNAESCLSNIKWNKKFSSLIFNLNVLVQEPLKPEDYLQFDQYNIAPGSLILGYDTIGKNLFHCYTDQDLDLVSSGMVRPKLTLTSAVNCYIAGMPELREPQQYYKWCSDNNLTQYGYDCHDPLHTGGSCVIGTPINWDSDGLTEWLVNSGSVRVKHWAIED